MKSGATPEPEHTSDPGPNPAGEKQARTPRFKIVYMHGLNLFLACVLVAESTFGYYHVPIPAPLQLERMGLNLWPLELIPCWFRHTISILAFAALLYFAGFVYGRTHDDNADGCIFTAGMLLFLGCMVQLSFYCSMFHQETLSNLFVLLGLAVIVLGAIVMARLGYNSD